MRSPYAAFVVRGWTAFSSPPNPCHASLMRQTIPTLLLCAACSGQKPQVQITPQDKQIHQMALVVDAHSGITEAIYYEHYDFFARHADRAVDLPRMREGGLDAEFFAVFVHPEAVEISQFFPEAMKQIDALQTLAKSSGGKLAQARTAQEVRLNAEKGVTSMLLGVDGGHMLLPGSEDEQLAHLKQFADRGVRYLTLSWSSSSPIGGSTAEAEQEGITAFGKRVVQEMERLGIVADLSHASDVLFWDVVRMTKKPVLLTNSSARALSGHPRNASDPMLEAVARNGGAVCVDFSRTFLDDRFRKATQSLLQKTKGMHNSEKVALYKNAKLPDVPLSRLAEHIDHIAKVAGIDHVCLGSDFDNAPMMPVGLEDASKLPALTAELRRRAWTEDNLRKLLGENILRVLAANEAR
jgi:membrane dipeptidase